jgi:hypothetical protein
MAGYLTSGTARWICSARCDLNALKMIPLIRLRKEQDVAGTYTVYFATNRMPETDATGGRIVGFGSDPGPIDGTAVRFGSADV